jgi:hypothetical protein
MKKALLAAAAVLPFALAHPAAAQKAGDKIAGSYICVFNDNVSRGNSQAEAHRSAQAANAQLKHVYSAALRGFAVNASEQGVANMKAHNPNIAYCEQDQVVTLSPIQASAAPGGGGTVQPLRKRRGASRASMAALAEPSRRRGSSTPASTSRIRTSTSTPRAAGASSATTRRRPTRTAMAPTSRAPSPRSTTPSA